MAENTYYPGDDPVYPALGYWRTKSFRKAIAVEHELVGFLVTHFAGDVDDGLLRRVRHGDPDAPLVTLWKLLEENSKALDEDDRGTWLLLAAVRQKTPLPSRLLALVLFERAARIGPDRTEETVRLLELAHMWNRLGRTDVCTHEGALTIFRTYRRYLRRFDDLAATRGTATSANRFLASGGNGIPRTAALRVIHGIGDDKSREGKELAQAYAALTAPLPLKGSDLPPDTLAAMLENEFPWMPDVVEHVRSCLRLRWSAGAPWFWIRPMLLVGPPGVGKTRKPVSEPVVSPLSVRSRWAQPSMKA